MSIQTILLNSAAIFIVSLILALLVAIIIVGVMTAPLPEIEDDD